MFTTAFISTALALGPPTELAPPDFGSQLDAVEFIDGGEDVQLVAYDAGGEVIGMIALWVDERERVHLASDYGDGYAEIVVVDGVATVDTTLPPEVTRERAQLMLARLDPSATRGKPSAVRCATTIAIGVGACSPVVGGAIVVTCPAAVFLAFCECAELLEIKSSACGD
jgi:hypothetical protein